jgi:colanic acid biosynthesis protein WcaH
MIPDKQFLQIIDNTPLVSIDLIIEDSQGKVLLGKRTNRPAQDYWFVPGGRIRKNETIAEAIIRISSTELGKELSINDLQLIGNYDHIYEDNYLGEDGVNTHYVVLAYRLKQPRLIEVSMDKIRDDQHSEIRYWTREALLKADEVHPNTKAYFSSSK